MKKILYALTLALPIIFLTACAAGKSGAREQLKFEINKFEKSKTFGDSTKSVSVVINYPVFSYAAKKEIEQNLNGFVDSLKLIPLADFAKDAEREENLDTLTGRLFSEYQKVTEDFPDYITPWEISDDIVPVYTDENAVTIKSEMFLQTGGAHPNTFVNYYSFDLTEGRLIKLSDIFEPGTADKLNETAERLFRKEKKIPADESLEKSGYWFENDKFKLNKNFGILKEGIIFHFNAYEIAPYSMGHSEILIPWDKIKNLPAKQL